jgi:hypothetical protein
MRQFALMRQFIVLGTIVSIAAIGLAAGIGWADSHEAATDPQAMIEKELAKIPSGEEGKKQLLDELNARLELTPEQVEQVKPILSETVDSLEQARERFKSGQLTPMALMMQIQMASRKASMQIDPLLTDEQRVEYKAMQQEQKQAMMAEMQKRRAAMGGGGM